MAENPEGVATKRCREEGKNVGTVVTGTDVGGVDGWDMDVWRTSLKKFTHYYLHWQIVGIGITLFDIGWKYSPHQKYLGITRELPGNPPIT